MAQSNKRYFNTYFFEDPYIEDLDFHTKYLYLTMILNPHNNLAGCYELSISRLKQYTGMSEDKIRIGIQKLQEDRKILFTGTWLSLKNFIKNNQLNPNMCKSAFDIMKAAPKENIIFIVSDSAGNAEPWLEEFVEKVGKGINASIDSKNRATVENSKKKSIPIPLLLNHQEFSTNNFIDSILNPTKTPLEGNRSPKGLPNHAKPKREPSAEYEYEFEKEYEKEEEEESSVKNAYTPPIIYDNTNDNIPIGSLVDSLNKKIKENNQ